MWCSDSSRLVIMLIIELWCCIPKNLVELRVHGKALMMSYGGDLVSLMISIIYFKMWLIVIKSWCCIGVCLVLGLIGWYDVKSKWLDYGFWGFVLRCKCYKDGEWVANVPYYEVIRKCAKLTYMNCNERIMLMQILLSYDDDEYTRVRPYDLR